MFKIRSCAILYEGGAGMALEMIRAVPFKRLHQLSD
jgi:hypothetical protein